MSMKSFECTLYALLMPSRRLQQTDPMPSFSFLLHRSIDIIRSPFSLNRKAHFFCKHKKQNIWLIFFLLDVDECSADSNTCDDNADCLNTEGSYSCRCKSGFTGNGTTCQGTHYYTRSQSTCSSC